MRYRIKDLSSYSDEKLAQDLIVLEAALPIADRAVTTGYISESKYKENLEKIIASKNAILDEQKRRLGND